MTEQVKGGGWRNLSLGSYSKQTQVMKGQVLPMVNLVIPGARYSGSRRNTEF